MKQKKWNNRYFRMIMVILLLMMTAGVLMYKGALILKGSQDQSINYSSINENDIQVSASLSDIYAQEGILHLKMVQCGGSENDKFTLTIRINEEKYHGEAVVDGTVVTIDDGKLKLKGGQSAEIGGIAYGSSCRITQKKDISYTTMVYGGDTQEETDAVNEEHLEVTGEITEEYLKVTGEINEECLEVTGEINEECPEATEVFTNILGRGCLTLRYTCNEDMDCRFLPFTVRIGGELYDGTVRIGDAEISVTDGIIWLTQNKIAAFENIPFGTAYEIKVQKYGSYSLTVDGMEICEASGIVSGQNANPEVVFEMGGEDFAGAGEQPGAAESSAVKATAEVIDTGLDGIVFLKAKDWQGEPAEGIRYQLFAKCASTGKISECWEAYDNDEEDGIYTTNFAGVLTAENLPANDYCFAELKGTNGYEFSGKKYVFTVEEDSETDCALTRKMGFHT